MNRGGGLYVATGIWRPGPINTWIGGGGWVAYTWPPASGGQAPLTHGGGGGGLYVATGVWRPGPINTHCFMLYSETMRWILKLKVCEIVTNLQESNGPHNNGCDGNTCLWTVTYFTMVALEQRLTKKCFMGWKLEPNFAMIGAWNMIFFFVILKIACGLYLEDNGTLFM